MFSLGPKRAEQPFFGWETHCVLPIEIFQSCSTLLHQACDELLFELLRFLGPRGMLLTQTFLCSCETVRLCNCQASAAITEFPELRFPDPTASPKRFHRGDLGCKELRGRTSTPSVRKNLCKMHLVFQRQQRCKVSKQQLASELLRGLGRHCRARRGHHGRRDDGRSLLQLGQSRRKAGLHKEEQEDNSLHPCPKIQVKQDWQPSWWWRNVQAAAEAGVRIVGVGEAVL